MRRLAAALVHYPVLDRAGEIVTTAITNLDLHDIARSAHTYGLEALYIVQPVKAQRELAERVREHWISGSGARRIPDRTPAMRGLRIVASLEDAAREHGGAEADGGARAELWVTSAKQRQAVLEHTDARALLRTEGAPVLLVFGTGWGLAPEVQMKADRELAAIHSPREDGYNHLSVRAAAAILFDRLLSPSKAP